MLVRRLPLLTRQPQLAFKLQLQSSSATSCHQYSSTSSPQPANPAQQQQPKDHLTPKERAAKQAELASVSASQSARAARAASKDSHDPNKKGEPKFLSRPLGLKQKPVKGFKPTREEWRKDFISQDRRLKERKHLVKEVSKGYFHDYNELRHVGGKGWIAPTTLIRSDLAHYFPDIEGVRLSDKAQTHTVDLFAGKASVVVVSSFQSSEEHINSFVRPTLSDLSENPLFQYVYINLQENPLKGFLVTMFLSSLRKRIPNEQQASYILSHQSLEYLREPMGMTNKHVGYVFLVDEVGKIRWAGCSWATPEEEESLRKCAWVLVERLKSSHK